MKKNKCVYIYNNYQAEMIIMIIIYWFGEVKQVR